MARKRRGLPGLVALGNGEYKLRARYGPRGNVNTLRYRGRLHECRTWYAEIRRRVAYQLPLYAPISGIENWPPQDVQEESLDAKSSRTTLYQLVEDYKNHPDFYLNRAKRTKMEIDHGFRLLLEWCDRNAIRFVDDIQARGDDFYVWIVQRYGEKEYAILKVIKRAKKLFAFALAKRRKDSAYCSLEFNPFEDCRPNQPTQKEIRFLSKERELPALRGHMTVGAMEPFGSAEYRRGIWELLYYCGMRPGELCHLRWRHVHEEEGYILITKTTKTEAALRGEEAFQPKVRKARESQNRIELHPKALAWLKYFRELHAKKQFCIGVRHAILSPGVLPENVIQSIFQIIEDQDRALTAKELYEELIRIGAIEQSTQRQPARFFAIRLSNTDFGGRLVRSKGKKKYGFVQHFTNVEIEVLSATERSTQVPIPIIRNAGPYVIGGDKPINEHNIYDWYCELIDATMAANPGLDLSDTSPKTFRASIGSHMIQLDENVTKVSKFLRHASVKVTEAHYASLLRNDIRAAISVVP